MSFKIYNEVAKTTNISAHCLNYQRILYNTRATYTFITKILWLLNTFNSKMNSQYSFTIVIFSINNPLQSHYLLIMICNLLFINTSFHKTIALQIVGLYIYAVMRYCNRTAMQVHYIN